ncbi:NAD(P)H-dependent flavin oxidoreductase [Peribacillus asahii]|uniref:NAD(P)H-dependent flavin oxidoreductase n=1 Tax=Peribacillus asahii TaxID=228899 RepID=UPI00207A53E1|nr:nitronate monooxygenase [Peribacillus asahii]USK70983.1 nitronate monooxygenase [Peribacillus asahii]
MLQNLVKYPIIQAPMAGGASNPVLAAAVSNAGGLGFLAAGYKTAEDVRKEIVQTRQMTEKPFGVNVFVPSDESVDEGVLAEYRQKIEQEALKIETTIGEAYSDDDEWSQKIAVLKEEKVPVVSFTFGCPAEEVIRELQQAGSIVIVTVTNVEEAKIAQERGANAVCAQGIEAGGHRGSFKNETEEDYGLLVLIRLIQQEIDLPIIAAGGIMNGKDVAAVLTAGATAAQLGTVFLRCPESGASSVHKAALVDSRFKKTALTRAFSGRRARGLVNYFLTTYSAEAPAAYPHLHHMTKTMRKVAGQKNEPELMALWAGQGHRLAKELPAGEVVREILQMANLKF